MADDGIDAPLTDKELERERRYAEAGHEASGYIVLRLLATIKESQTGREKVHAYCGLVERHRDELLARLDAIKEPPVQAKGGE